MEKFEKYGQCQNFRVFKETQLVTQLAGSNGSFSGKNPDRSEFFMEMVRTERRKYRKNLAVIAIKVRQRLAVVPLYGALMPGSLRPETSKGY